jgi:REP element-mobilizing transposase RayT
MARLGRYFLPDQPLHAIQRGNNREAIFFAEADFACTRDWLAAATAEYGCAIHPSVLMTNHVHLLVTPGGPRSLPRTMQSLGRRTIRHINVRYRRTAREGRYRAAPIAKPVFSRAVAPSSSIRCARAWFGIPAMMRGSSDNAHARGAMDPLRRVASLCRSRSRDYGADSLQILADLEFSGPNVIRVLQVQPDLHRRVERLRQPERGVCGDARFFVRKPFDPGTWDTADLRERAGR